MRAGGLALTSRPSVGGPRSPHGRSGSLTGSGARRCVCARAVDAHGAQDLLATSSAVVDFLAAQLHGLPPLADVAAQAADSPATKTDWLTPLGDGFETVLTTIEAQLAARGVPYAYGWSIIALTLVVKVLTTPLTKQQVESSLAMQELKPRVDAIRERYGEDKDRVSRETSILYEEAGVNPLAGCLPTLATIPIFWGLFRSLSNISAKGEFAGAGFYWIPNLTGPTSVAERASGAGTAWLFPFVDGQPPIGWEDAAKYLVLPVGLVIMQYISTSILSPPVDEEDENQKATAILVKLLPLMLGWFALNVPSGISLYYFSNTVLTTAQQIYLRKLGGAATTVDASKLDAVGTAVRSGQAAEQSYEDAQTPDVSMDLTEANDAMQGGEGSEAMTAAAAVSGPMPNLRCKRKRAGAGVFDGLGMEA
ncbi:unnamed protein product [Pedinophyceae sp. YPF-701]|nr:unnamed protein product [Pedinophyceae sp. YPF-701]